MEPLSASLSLSVSLSLVLLRSSPFSPFFFARLFSGKSQTTSRLESISTSSQTNGKRATQMTTSLTGKFFFLALTLALVILFAVSQSFAILPTNDERKMIRFHFPHKHTWDSYDESTYKRCHTHTSKQQFFFIGGTTWRSSQQISQSHAFGAWLATKLPLV